MERAARKRDRLDARNGEIRSDCVRSRTLGAAASRIQSARAVLRRGARPLVEKVKAALSDGAIFRVKTDGARPNGDIPAKP